MKIKQRPTVPIDTNRMELFNYPSPTLPYNILFADIANYVPATVPWHWHKESELVVIYSGQVTVCFSNKRLVLQEGDGLFINSNVLHSMQIPENGHCEILTLIFEPTFFLGGLGSIMFQKYAFPILNSPNLASLFFSNKIAWQQDCIACMKQVYASYIKEKSDFELLLCETLLHIWNKLYTNSSSLLSPNLSTTPQKDQRIKQMLDFIHSNYMHPITLSQIAQSAHISTRACSRCFASNIKTSPITYLTKHRMALSADMLIHSTASITTIALKTGYNSPSHFSKIFKHNFMCTPYEYRSNQKND